MAKENRVSIRLNDDIHSKLKLLASEFGITPSALSTVIIGEAVSSKYRSLETMKRKTDEIDMQGLVESMASNFVGKIEEDK